MTTNAWLAVATVLVLTVLAVLGWVNRYEYHQTHNDYLVRINRLTGATDFLTVAQGWRRTPISTSSRTPSEESTASLRAKVRRLRARVRERDSTIEVLEEISEARKIFTDRTIERIQHQLDSLRALR